MKPVHILLVDPIAYAGGSKVATLRILKMLDSGKARVTIVTRDPDSWNAESVKTSPLFEPTALSGKDQGVGYFLRHILIVFSLLWARVAYGRFDRALGASGPGIDLSLYLAQRLLGYQVIQLVHGPVAQSRTIARALKSADRVFYLETAEESLCRALGTIASQVEIAQMIEGPKFASFENGLCDDQWPTLSSPAASGIFWASSLLKWKGLEIMTKALELLPPASRPATHICYIRPRDTNLELGPEPTEIDRVQWYETPSNLDQIRASCSLFVSTSKKEPFGLSILESMAAGLAILIPRDGAYWDRKLEDRKHCLKYRAGDPEDLALKILYLLQNPGLVEKLGQHSRLLARQYQAERVYGEILGCLTLADPGASSSNSEKVRVIDHAQV